jgi:phosphonate transport system substrate-binding protein
VAFVSLRSFCSITLRHEGRDVELVPRYVGTTANAYKHVILGLTPAGGVLDVDLADAPAEIREKLRVIYRTPPMAPHAIVVHPRVPRADAERVAAAVKALARSEAGARLLGQVHMELPVTAEYRRDYAPLEHILGEPEEGDARRGE